MQVLCKTVVYSKRIMRAPVNDAYKGPLPFSSKSNSIMYIDVERFVSNQLILGLANFELLLILKMFVFFFKSYICLYFFLLFKFNIY